MRCFDPFGQNHSSSPIAFGYRSEAANIGRVGPSCAATFDLDQDDLEKITAFEITVNDRMIFANRHQIDNSRRFSSGRSGKPNELPTSRRFDARFCQLPAAGFKTDTPLSHRRRPLRGANGGSGDLLEIERLRLVHGYLSVIRRLGDDFLI